MSSPYRRYAVLRYGLGMSRFQSGSDRADGLGTLDDHQGQERGIQKLVGVVGNPLSNMTPDHEEPFRGAETHHHNHPHRRRQPCPTSARRPHPPTGAYPTQCRAAPRSARPAARPARVTSTVFGSNQLVRDVRVEMGKFGHDTAAPIEDAVPTHPPSEEPAIAPTPSDTSSAVCPLPPSTGFWPRP